MKRIDTDADTDADADPMMGRQSNWQFGGFYLVEVENDAEALSYAQRIPGAESRAIEVRPFLHFSAS